MVIEMAKTYLEKRPSSTAKMHMATKIKKDGGGVKFGLYLCNPYGVSMSLQTPQAREINHLTDNEFDVDCGNCQRIIQSKKMKIGMHVLNNYGDIADIKCCGVEERLMMDDGPYTCPKCGKSWMLIAKVVEYKEEEDGDTNED